MLNDCTGESEKTWDAIAQSFDTTRRKPWKQCIDFIDTFTKEDLIVDVCCGNGRHLIPCAKRCKKAIGIDLSRKFLYIVQKKLDEKNLDTASLLHSNVAHIPLKHDTVDAVLYIASLHNIKGRDRRIQSLREVGRLLKNDGKALISVWSRWQDRYRKQFFKKWFTQMGQAEFGDIDIYWRQHGLEIPRFYHLYSKREFLSDLRKADLEIIDIQDVKMHSEKHPDNYFAMVKKSHE
jgi:ubiquinone/menaquinone biosynthesis C-methylase UbiE